MPTSDNDKIDADRVLTEMMRRSQGSAAGGSADLQQGRALPNPVYDATPPGDAYPVGVPADEHPLEYPTLGEQRVRYKFNPSGSGVVYDLKERAADFITLCSRKLEDATDGEEKRLWNLAMTHAEDAAMWAVKAATFQK